MLSRTLFLCGALALLGAGPAFSHARMKAGKPFALRNGNDANKEAVKPCGPGARNAAPTWVKPGAVITVEWEETVQHPGRFIFSFSASGDNFSATPLLTVTDVQDNAATLPHSYTAQITMPNMEAPLASIQMIQVMTENPNAPTNYYSCADIYLSATAPATPSPAPSASATPAPASSASPTAAPSAAPKPGTPPAPAPKPQASPSPSASPAPKAAEESKATGDTKPVAVDPNCPTP